MEKPPTFHPTMSSHGNFHNEVSIDASESYFDATKKRLLLFPARAFEKEKKWFPQRYAGDFLKRMPGREGEVIDQEKVEYFEKPRGSLNLSKAKISNQTSMQTISTLNTNAEPLFGNWRHNSKG